MDIISPPHFSSRKRSWGDEQLDRPHKRTSHSRTRDRPQCTALGYQAQNLPLDLDAQPGDDIMMAVDEPQWHRTVSRLPQRHVSQPIPVLFASSVTSAPLVPSTQKPSAISTGSIPAAPPEFPSSSTKKRFAMGPRNDCARCMAGEPGHYGHWL